MSPSNIIHLRENMVVIDHGMVRSFLFIGEKEALLVDSGFGAGLVKGLVASVTDLPIRVVYTHSDKDHFGNAEDFENRWMHPSEYANYASKTEQPLPM